MNIIQKCIMKKILLIEPFGHKPGAANYFRSLVDAIKTSKDFDRHVELEDGNLISKYIGEKGELINEILFNTSNYFYRKNFSKVGNVTKFILYFRIVRLLTKTKKFDVVFFNSIDPSLFPIMVRLWPIRGKLFIRFGGYEFRNDKSLVRYLTVFLRLIIWQITKPEIKPFVETSMVKEQFLKLGYRNIELILHPFWRKLAKRQFKKKKIEKRIKMLIFGHRPKSDKDVGFVLESLKGKDDFNLKIVGFEQDSAVNSDIEKKIKKFNLHKRVIFENRHVTEKEKKSLFMETDLVVLPYRPQFNGGSGVLFDAISYGIPILASNSGEFVSLFDDGNFGLLFEYGNKKSFVNCISLIRKDISKYFPIDFKAAEKLFQERNFDVIATKISKLEDIKKPVVHLEDGLNYATAKTGIGNVSFQLFESMKKHVNENEKFDVVFVENSLISSFKNYFVRKAIYIFWKNFLFERFVPSGDIVHNLNHKNSWFKKKGVKHVYTIHDLVASRAKEWLPKNDFVISYERQLCDILRTADSVLVPTFPIRDELLKLYSDTVSSSKVVRVIHSYIEKPLNSSSGFEQAKGTKPFFLVVGTVEARKNVITAIEAFKLLLEKGYDCELQIAGKIGFKGNKVAEKIKSEQLEKNVKLLGFISQDLLDQLYRDCVSVVFPSFYEGFGLPILEAIKHGKLIICSDIPVFRSILSDKGIYYGSPEDKKNLSIQMKNSLEGELQFLGYGDEFHEKYSSKSVYQSHAEIYRKLIT